MFLLALQCRNKTTETIQSYKNTAKAWDYWTFQHACKAIVTKKKELRKKTVPPLREIRWEFSSTKQYSLPLHCYHTAGSTVRNWLHHQHTATQIPSVYSSLHKDRLHTRPTGSSVIKNPSLHSLSWSNLVISVDLQGLFKITETPRWKQWLCYVLLFE